MRILSAVQATLAIAFILFGLVALFGIGITGLLFLVPGAVFAATAATTQEKSRVGTILALAVDAVLGYLSVDKLVALFASEPGDVKLHHAAGAWAKAGLFDYLPAVAGLVLVGIATLAVLMDWRALRNSPWF